MVERGSEAAETIPVGPEPGSGKATARVRVQAAGITLTVESGEEDVDALFGSIARDQAALVIQLAACNAASSKAAREMADRHRDATGAAATRKDVYEGLLQSKTFEQWEADVAAVENLAADRTRHTPGVKPRGLLVFRRSKAGPNSRLSHFRTVRSTRRICSRISSEWPSIACWRGRT
jgi:hypothetical protein